MKPYRPILLLTINENLIISGVLPVALPGESYIGTLVGRGGLEPYLWFLDSGSLPSGLTLSTDSNNNGIISGTTSDLGNHTFVILLRDSEGRTAAREFTLVVQTDALTITGDATNAEVDEPYSFTYDIEGGIPPYFPSVVVMPGFGPLPSGLTLAFDSNDDLTLYGTPDVAGTYTFQIWLNDSQTPSAGFASLVDTMTVGAAPLTVTGAFVDTDLGDPLNGSPLAISGGLAPYSLSGSPYSGTRPAGVTISVSGTDLVATGNTTTEASYSWTERVLSSDAQHYDVVCSLDVVAGDPYWANVSSLLHFIGADASTTFTDEKSLVWTPSGNAQIDTAQYKFPPSSGLFDGSGDYISTPNSTGLNMGTSDFTVECFARSHDWGNNRVVFSFSNGWCMFATSNGSMVAYMVGSGNLAGTAGGAATIDTWVHWAVVREGTQVRLYRDGVRQSEYAANSTNITGLSLYLGRYGPSAGSYFNGHIAEFRLTKGVARYTSDFTPPIAPYPNS